MKTIKNTLLTLALGGLLVGSAVAQTTSSSTTSGAGPGVYDPNHPRVNQVNSREQNQQDRIANGIKSDKLSPGQTAKLEKQENHIAKQEKKDMAKHNGHLTKGEQVKLNKDLNHTSREIHRDKQN
ncbi:MAG: hypothetical protein ABSD96_09760 [Candidatus Korobacteraceae bacterium]|jgi:hypothetical protein